MLDASPDTLLDLLVEGLAKAGVSVERSALTPETSLNEDLGVDSFQLTTMARHLEEAYDLRFTLVDWVLAEEELETPTYTVRSLLAFVQAQLALAP